MKTDYTHITLVVDRSGSMNLIRQDAQGGINTLIEDQKAVPGSATITLYQFDTYYDRVFGPVDVKEAPAYELSPRGSTALLDATYRAITETGEFLRDLPEDQRPSQVKFIVVTDGQENSSREVKRQQLRDAIKHQEENYNWEFIFIGSDPSTYAESVASGFSNAVTYTASTTADMYRGLSKGIMNSRLTGTSAYSNMNSTYDDSTVLADSLDSSS